jgi:hypothetical protein
LLNEHIRQQAIYALEKNVDKKSELDRWLVFKQYKIIFDETGNRYIHAPRSRNSAANEVSYERSRPLNRTSADLFLKFARWPEEHNMDKELDTKRNAEAALKWAARFGVLGLNPGGISIPNIVNSQRVTADYLGVPELGEVKLGEVRRGRRNLATGGMPHESVANFAFEAWEAHITWRLYESVRSEGTADESSIIHFMSTIDQMDADITASSGTDSWVERDIYSRDTELTRRWALTVVSDAVNSKLENHCYPLIHGDSPGSYERAWVFKSLLGAMWMQMGFLMLEDRRCWWCGKPLDPGMRRHARFCKNNGRCRSNWNFNEGSGKSSKRARKQARIREYSSSRQV